MNYSNGYKTEYGVVSYSTPFKLTGILGVQTRKFNKSTIGIKITNDNLISLLESEGIKKYGSNLFFIELRDNQEVNENNIRCSIKKFTDLKGDVHKKLLLNTYEK